MERMKTSAAIQKMHSDPDAKTGGVPKAPNSAVVSWAIVLGVLLLAASYWPVWLTLHRRWQQWSEFYSHGYPLLALAMYCLIDSRQHLLARSARPALLYAAGIAALFFEAIWLGAWLAQVEIVQQLLLLPLIFICAYLMLGWRASLLLGLPLALLLLGIPVWDYLIPLLQFMAMTATRLVFHLLSIPNRIDNNIIYLPGGIVEIAGGCSGLSFLLVSLALGLLYCRQNRLAVGSALAVIAVVALSGLSSNWLRVTSLALIGNYTAMRHPLMTNHFYYGWLIFFCCFLLTLLLLQRLPLKVMGDLDETPAAPVSLRRIVCVVGLGMLAPVSAAIIALYSSPPIQPRQQELVAMLAAQRWALSDESAQWHHGFTGFDRELHLRSADWPGVTLEIVRYAEQAAGKKLINSTNAVLADKRWSIEAQTVQRGDQAIEMILRGRDRERLLVWYWYEVGDRLALRSIEAKREQIVAALHGRRDGAWLALSLQCDTDCARERAVISHARPGADTLYRQLFQDR